MPAIVIRRNKLGSKLWEQIQLAKSQLDGTPFVVMKYKTFKDRETGLRKQVEIPEPAQDAYTIDGYPRKLVKKAFNILINLKKPAPASNSLIFYLNKNKQQYVDDKHPTAPTVDKDYCLALEQAIRDHHKPIEHFFCTGVGLIHPPLSNDLGSTDGLWLKLMRKSLDGSNVVHMLSMD
jgi:hypothetical protein